MPMTSASVHFTALYEGVGYHTLIPAPDPGTSILINQITLFNQAWAANFVVLKMTNEITLDSFTLYIHFSMPMFTKVQIPTRYMDGPIVMESGWRLEVYSDDVTIGGLVVGINYGVDTGYNGKPSDYHAQMIKCDAPAGETTLPAVGPAPEYKIRHAKSIVFYNADVVTHNMWIAMRDAGGARYRLFVNPGNVPLINTIYSPIIGEGITIDENSEIAINKSVNDNTNPVWVWSSYLEAGGHEGIGPSDSGPWTDSHQVIQSRSIALDGALDRLMTYPTAAAPIGIADEWTIFVWSRPMGWSANTEWLFMLGGLSNTGAIHLSRNTTPAGGNPYEIEIHEGAVTKKLWRWYGGALTGYWEPVAVRFVGSKPQANKLDVFVNGEWYIWPAKTVTKITNEDIGTLTDTDRFIGLGGAPTGTGTNTDGFWGRIWNAAVWSTGLSNDAIAQISDPAHSQNDLREECGAYTAAMAASLEHYYRPGLRYSPNLGEDFGLGGNLTDLTFEEDVDDTDLVDENPLKGPP